MKQSPLHNLTLPAASEGITLSDCSLLDRAGLKGPHAAQWLQARGIATPEQVNSWLPIGDDGLIARLGLTEYLIEDVAAAQALRRQLQSGIEGVYPVLRQDASLAISGAAVNDLLLETCSVNFAALPSTQRWVVMTSIVGVSVTMLQQARQNEPCYRIWCDPSFGHYLGSTLLEVMQDMIG